MSPRSALVRYHIEAAMVLTAPLAIAGAAGTGSIDHPVARNGAGQPYLPGTSLAGALRAGLPDFGLTEAEVVKLCGGSGEGDHASLLWVEDATLAAAVIEERTGVGIDRVTGAAAPAILYNREVVGAGATTRIRLRVDAPGATTETLPAVNALAGLLTAGLTIGSGTTKGLGRIELADDETVEVRRLSFLSRSETLEALRGGSRIEATPTDRTAEVMRFTIQWQPVGPVMVRANADGNAIDDLPLVTHVAPERLAFAIPGSSFKGAFRAHAEKIVRTVLGTDATSISTGHHDEFNQQLDVPLVHALFGRPAAQGPADGSGKASAADQGKGAVRFSEARSSSTFSRGAWLAIADAARAKDVPRAPATATGAAHPDDGVPSELDAVVRAVATAGFRQGEVEPGMHVAIDRWTGGASESALFSSLEVRLQDWTPLIIELDAARLTRRLGDQAQTAFGAAVFLLLLTIRDFADGWIPIGFAVNRGYGSVCCPEPIVLDISSEFPLREHAGWSGSWEVATNNLTGLEQQWTAWVASRKEGMT